MQVFQAAMGGTPAMQPGVAQRQMARPQMAQQGMMMGQQQRMMQGMQPGMPQQRMMQMQAGAPRMRFHGRSVRCLSRDVRHLGDHYLYLCFRRHGRRHDDGRRPAYDARWHAARCGF